MTIITDPIEMMKCPLGIYLIYWTDNGVDLDGGFSVASVGMGLDGTRWIAPSNWVATAKLDGEDIYKMIRLFGQSTYSGKQLTDMIANHILLGE